jgi:hypothetical protein
MQMRPVLIEQSQHTAVFDSLTQLALGFARIASGADTGLLLELDKCLVNGWMARVQFTIGAAGPLGCSLDIAHVDGRVAEILNIDAPPSGSQFRFERADWPS